MARQVLPRLRRVQEVVADGCPRIVERVEEVRVRPAHQGERVDDGVETAAKSLLVAAAAAAHIARPHAAALTTEETTGAIHRVATSLAAAEVVALIARPHAAALTIVEMTGAIHRATATAAAAVVVVRIVHPDVAASTTETDVTTDMMTGATRQHVVTTAAAVAVVAHIARLAHVRIFHWFPISRDGKNKRTILVGKVVYVTPLFLSR